MIKVFFGNVSALQDVAASGELYSSLPRWRREITDSIKSNKEKLLSAGAGLLLAPALAVFGIDARAAAVKRAEHGKPYLVDYPNIHFSLSHSGEMVMCAVADAPIGCDIQRIQGAHISVAKRFFTSDEQKHIYMSDDAQTEFVRIWVLKESYVKLTGDGIAACPLTSFEVLSTKSPNNAVFYEYCLSGYRAAVCCEHADNIVWQSIRLA
ncbi:MAG: 4'-phosphopantetheinyl transferase superfamily protein [Clostridia bacterium]|nr:4'-phosphopantetheinyl transferase superfamily protein [Clostridia bacterium]